jgi:SNF2 family DNA or RNA helicase
MGSDEDELFVSGENEAQYHEDEDYKNEDDEDYESQSADSDFVQKDSSMKRASTKTNRRGHYPKTSKEWHDRHTNTSKNIEGKRPFEEFMRGDTGYVPRPKRRPARSMPSAAKGVLENLRSNPINARKVFGDTVDDFSFKASKKGEQFTKFLEQASNRGDGDLRATVTDLGKLKLKARSFGLGRCKPADGKWNIKGMKTPLYNHQMMGAAWMLQKEFERASDGGPGDRGGINADEMGMGKTLETLACIVSNPPDEEYKQELGGRTTLIIVPPAIVHQWVAESKKHTELRRIIHYKASRKLDRSYLNTAEIM